ncbi:MAG TPA: glycosyltransferase family 9 protein [Candidatus Binatia bacterium]|nr:glycosyltransferase family 9 protein [Candidatus Binatia bacterium]
MTVVFPGALGDFLLALPALRALRTRHPTARLTLVVAAHVAGLARLALAADAIASLDAAEAAWLFGGATAPAWLDARPVVYSWLGGGDAAVRARLASRAAAVHCFAVERGPGRLHAAVACARAVGVAADVRALAAQAAVVPPASAAADALAPGSGRPLLAIHPGAGARAKRWDAAGFVQVAQWWRRRGGLLVEVAGPAEAGDPPLLGAPAARELPLADLAALLARCALYLGNDSGVSHLAAAVGTPSVVLFGPTERRRWRPLGTHVAALQARGAGPDGITLAALPATRVIAACGRRLSLTTRNSDISVRP